MDQLPDNVYSARDFYNEVTWNKSYPTSTEETGKGIAERYNLRNAEHRANQNTALQNQVFSYNDCPSGKCKDVKEGMHWININDSYGIKVQGRNYFESVSYDERAKTLYLRIFESHAWFHDIDQLNIDYGRSSFLSEDGTDGANYFIAFTKNYFLSDTTADDPFVLKFENIEKEDAASVVKYPSIIFMGRLLQPFDDSPFTFTGLGSMGVHLNRYINMHIDEIWIYNGDTNKILGKYSVDRNTSVKNRRIGEDIIFVDVDMHSRITDTGSAISPVYQVCHSLGFKCDALSWRNYVNQRGTVLNLIKTINDEYWEIQLKRDGEILYVPHLLDADQVRGAYFVSELQIAREQIGSSICMPAPGKESCINGGELAQVTGIRTKRFWDDNDRFPLYFEVRTASGAKSYIGFDPEE